MRLIPRKGPARWAVVAAFVVVTLVLLVVLFEAVNRLLPSSF